MPTYLQLNREAVWRAQYIPDALEIHLNIQLRDHYGLGLDSVGSPGDNNHLYGRHRSADWDRTSAYCTNRSYGTTDARDKRGDQAWYRASDAGIPAPELYAACHRVDDAVRAGRLPGVAEWFGTFDGKTVVGWYQGHPSTSDSSHLTHLHVGFWNESANDRALMDLVFAIITGTAPEEDDDMARPHFHVTEKGYGGYYRADPNGLEWLETEAAVNLSLGAYGMTREQVINVPLAQTLREAFGPIPGVDPAPPSGGGSTPSGPVDLTDAAVEKVADAVVDEAHERLES